MKAVIALLFFAALAVNVAQQAESDIANIDEILNNERLYKKYFECIMGRGQCTPEGKKFKDALPKAIDEDCSKCTEEEKADTKHIIKFMLEKRVKDFEEFEKTFDPKQALRKKYA